MIERLLIADEALAAGELERAHLLYDQVATADPRNAMAVVGLARVAKGRGDLGEARNLAGIALVIDPDEAAAHRLLTELDAETELEAAPRSIVAGTRFSPPARRGPLARARAWLRRVLRRD